MLFKNRQGVPRDLGRYLAKLALVLALQFIGGKLGDALHTINSGGIGPVWPASGIALGAMLVWGNSVWPGVAGGAFLLTLLGGCPFGLRPFMLAEQLWPHCFLHSSCAG